MINLKKISRLTTVIFPTALLVSFTLTPVVFADSGWSQFAKTSTGSQDTQNWMDTATSYTGQYQAALVWGGDIYESTNYGQTWADVTSSTTIGTQDWYTIALSASGQRQLATGDSGQVYESTDYGQTWTSSAPSDTASDAFDGAAMSSSGQYQVITATGSDIFVSTDYGQTWTNETTSTPASGQSWDSVSMSVSGQYMVAPTDQEGVYVSSDYGKTWTNTATSGPLSDSYVWASAMSASGQVVYEPVYNGDIYKSTDYGQTWTDITNGAPDLNNQEVYFVTTSANGQDVAFAGYNGDVYVSSNGGQSWTDMTTGGSLSGAGFYPIAFSGSGEYLTSDVYAGGIYVSSNPSLAVKDTAAITNASTNTPVSIAVSAGTNITCDSSTTEANLATQDNGYTYPLGLINLCYSTINTSDQVTMIFDTSLTPSQVTARDYNTTTKQWMTIPGAVITQTTLNGHPALQLTYTLIDNGSLDSSSAAGLVTDPVGLAVAATPNTGYGAPNNTPLPAVLIVSSALSALAGIGIYRRKRV